MFLHTTRYPAIRGIVYSSQPDSRMPPRVCLVSLNSHVIDSALYFTIIVNINFRGAIIVGIFYALPTMQLLIFHQRVKLFCSSLISMAIQALSLPFTLVVFKLKILKWNQQIVIMGKKLSLQSMNTLLYILYRFSIGVGTKMLATTTSCVLVQLFS